MKYQIIIHGNSYNELVRLVNEALASGWRCQGGVATDYDGKYMQAMIRD